MAKVKFCRLYQVGVLKGRAYDVELVTRNGGILQIVDKFGHKEGIDQLLKNLRTNDTGFLTDEDSFYAYVAMYYAG